MFRQGPSGGPTQQGQSNFSSAYLDYYNTHVFNNNPSQHARFRRNNDQPYPPSSNGQQQHQEPYANQRQSSFVPNMQPQAYKQAPRQNTLASDPILGEISQLMEQMTRMNSRVDEMHDFVKRNVQPTTDKKGKQVSFSDQRPSQATDCSRNQGASSSHTHNINHVHVNEEAVEMTLAISSLRSGKDLLDPYKDHPIHQGTIDEDTPIIVEHDSDLEDEEEHFKAKLDGYDVACKPITLLSLFILIVILV